MITFDNISFTYDKVDWPLKDVSAHVNAGEFVCILGGNGSGKSTLAKHVNALLIPDKGRVTVDGLDSSDLSNLFGIRSTAGMVFQNPDDQIVASVVKDDVAFGPENLGVEPEEIRRRVAHALEQVGLESFGSHESYALSGGQKQRVAIAGVLAMEPRILVLDEASAMLDPRGRRSLMRVCRELNSHGLTILMITHFMEEAAQADRIIVMNDGRIALSGTPSEVLTQTDILRGLNLEVPFACKLSMALRDRGLDVPVCVDDAPLVNEIAPYVVGKPAIDRVPSENQDMVSDAPDLISIEGVGYAYDAAAGKKRAKQLRAEKERDHAKAIRPNGKVAWGNDPDAIWALLDVSFTIKKGEFLGIAGHTGSGKSTLIQHLNGIVHPTMGRVLVAGKDVADKKNHNEVRQKVGVVFQYPEHQLFSDTVYNDVAFGPRNLGLSDGEVEERVRQSLESLDLDYDSIAQRNPFELSGGQQRRVAFAGVLAMAPEVLVLDEPVAGLDPIAKRDFLGLIERLHRVRGITIVMVSHNMDDLALCCDRIAILSEGRLTKVGTPRQVFLQAEDMNRIGLGVPSAQAVANGLRLQGAGLDPDRLYDLDTLVEDILALAASPFVEEVR